MYNQKIVRSREEESRMGRMVSPRERQDGEMAIRVFIPQMRKFCGSKNTI